MFIYLVVADGGHLNTRPLEINVFFSSLENDRAGPISLNFFVLQTACSAKGSVLRLKITAL